MLKYNLVSSDDLLVYLTCFLTVVFYARLHSGDQIPQIEDSCFITPPFFFCQARYLVLITLYTDYCNFGRWHVC